MIDEHEAFLFTIPGAYPRPVFRRAKTGILHIRSPFGSDDFKRDYEAFVSGYGGNPLLRRARDRFHRLQASLYAPDRGALGDLLARIATPVPRVPTIGRFLDIGCNTASMLSMLPDPWERYGVEISAPAAAVARSHSNVFVHEGPLSTYETDTCFDFVRASHVVEHVDDPEGFLRTLYDLTAQGGRVLLYTPNTGSPSFRIFKQYWQPFYEQTHVYLFNIDNLSELVTAVGFEVVESGTFYMGLWADSLLRLARVPEESSRFRLGYFTLMLALYPLGLIAARLKLCSAMYLYLAKRPATAAGDTV